jgi:hypothetical protein
MTVKLSLQELFDFAQTRAADMFKQSGSLAPFWHAVAGNGEHLLICTPWDNDEDKEFAVQALRELFADKQVTQYVFISEAWLVSVPVGTKVNSVRASTHKDRREVLRVQAEDDQGRVLSGQFYILRPEHGEVTLSPFKKDDTTYNKGRLTGLLQRNGSTQ